MKDSAGRIIYVGKAKVLKSRVAQYFQSTDGKAHKAKALVEEIFSFDIMVTRTEVEALLLERTLIKHHKPRYNILLRDDKEYPYLRIDLNATWPRIEQCRRRKDDKATYLGPFGSAGQMRLLLDACHRIFPTVRCSEYEFANAKRPCNYYHMKMCLAPCTKDVARSEYLAMARDAVAFLGGENQSLLASLKARMAEAADTENYELAALLRDQLQAIIETSKSQVVVVKDSRAIDVIGISKVDTSAAVAVLTVRDGLLVGQDSFVLSTPLGEEPEILRSFILQYYESRSLPKLVYLPMEVENQDELRLALLFAHPDAAALTLLTPRPGTVADLLELAHRNAKYVLDDHSEKKHQHRQNLRILQENLGLTRFPLRMECIDISNTQGLGIVASNVCFVGGRPERSLYRHYNIKDYASGPDDFAAIEEVVRRRLARASRDQDLCDLLVIDGGKGQLSAALKAAAEFPQLAFDIIALAKAKERKGGKKFFHTRDREGRSFERVFKPGQDLALPLAPGTPEFRLLTQIRDEAHRFALSHHRRVRTKLSHHSSLLDIPGIGPKLRHKLLTEFGGMDGLTHATLEQLTAIKGLPTSSALALYAKLQGAHETDAEDRKAKDQDPAEGNSTKEHTSSGDQGDQGDQGDHGDQGDQGDQGEALPRP